MKQFFLKSLTSSYSSIVAEAPNPDKRDFFALFFFFLEGGGSGVHFKLKKRRTFLLKKVHFFQEPSITNGVCLGCSMRNDLDINKKKMGA